MSCDNQTDFETPEQCCPSKFCDDRLSGLPTKRRIQVIGVTGRCLERFHPNRNGVILYDGAGGAIVTEQPRLRMPIARSLLLDGAGKPIQLPSGEYQEDDPPPMDFLIGAQCDGLQFRVKGKGGTPQLLKWDGCKYVHVDASLDDTLDNYEYVGPDFGGCNVYDRVLILHDDGTVSQGYRPQPVTPVGSMMMWGGDKSALPAAWIACEGQELSTKLYPDLFLAWGYKWGGSAGSFRAPDGRGRFFRGVNDSGGVDPDAGSRTALHSGGNTGDAVGTYQGDSFAGTGKKFEDDAANDTAFATEVRPVNLAVFLIAYAGCILEE